MAEARLDGDPGSGGNEANQPGGRVQEGPHRLGQVRDAHQPATDRRVGERALRRPLRDAHLALHPGSDQVVGERRPEPGLGDHEAQAGLQPGSRIASRRQSEQERAQIDAALGLVGLRKAIVIERKRRGRRDEIRGVVSERRGRVPILDEVARGPREDEPADESRRLGHAVHPVARLRGELEDNLAGAELGTNDA